MPLDVGDDADEPRHRALVLGARESGTAHLEEAVAAYRAALEERTRDRVPLDWAMTQMNLGTALETLGQRESGTAHLEEAVAALDACLAVTNSVWPSDGFELPKPAATRLRPRSAAVGEMQFVSRPRLRFVLACRQIKAGMPDRLGEPSRCCDGDALALVRDVGRPA